MTKYRVSIGAKRKYLTVIPKPTSYVKNGIKITMSTAEHDYCEPIATTDIVKGKCRYYLPRFYQMFILRAEIQ